MQFLEFVRTIDSKFEKYDVEGACRAVAIHGGGRLTHCGVAAWPSTIDDFVEYAKNRVAGNA